jgi:3-oxoacyl-[acyl-carrier-protein] synthase-3
MKAAIRSIAYHLPERVLTNEALSAEFPDWRVEKIRAKTGIDRRHIAAEDECASDLAVAAARRLFDDGGCRPEDVDFLLLCTQSPDYVLPTTACLVQDRLGLRTGIGALDFNLGCSGFVYGLGLAKGLVETGQARSVLLLTAETYSKFLHREDRGCRTVFGDAAAATLIRGFEGIDGPDPIGPFVFGTDGRGAPNLIVATGGARRPRSAATAEPYEDERGNTRVDDCLFMDGPEIFAFTIQVVGPMVDDLLARAGIGRDQVDLFVFHQANRFMLNHLRSQLEIPEERFYLALGQCGNTVSSTIPIALKEAEAAGVLRPGQRVMAVGFGVGYSWGATLLLWMVPVSASRLPARGANLHGS